MLETNEPHVVKANKIDPNLQPLPEVKDGEPLVAQAGQVKPEGKHWYQSKTIWFNAAVIAAGLATAATPALEQYMTEDTYSLLAAGVAFVNAAIRLATGQPIKG